MPAERAQWPSNTGTQTNNKKFIKERQGKLRNAQIKNTAAAHNEAKKVACHMANGTPRSKFQPQKSGEKRRLADEVAGEMYQFGFGLDWCA